MIRITDEHPVFIEGRGWTSVCEVVAGDRLSALSLPVGSFEREALVIDARSTAGGVETYHTSRDDRSATWERDLMRQQHLIDISEEFEGTYSIGTAINHEPGVTFTEPAEEDLPPWSSDWLVVESNASTGEHDLVYNFRVAEWHTYFVGSDTWGFSLWVPQ